MDLRASHYKESSPEKTISQIRSLLGALDVLVVEQEWHSSQDCYHSLTLAVEGTSFTVNGKGVTRSLALASAYGELMERMQNMTVFKMVHDFSKLDQGRYGFYYAPDEIVLNAEELLEQQGIWLATHTAKKRSDEIWELMAAWRSIPQGNAPGGFVCLPFMHIRNGSVEFLPVAMVSKMYTSNGMAAGNTMDEAYVQALSEIYERYATIQILSNKITPPNIPRGEIAQNRRLHNMVGTVEQSGRYTLSFKDCSLGIGLPVVAAVCIDSDTGKYFVKFGAHPVFEIAVERTLTELLQGQSLENMHGMRPYMHDTQKACARDNIYGILVNGCGDYPYTFFNGTPAYSHVPFARNTNINNNMMWQRMVQDTARLGWHIFVRDVSFLGFPSCQMIVPGISEVEPFDDAEGLQSFAEYCYIIERLQNVDRLSRSEICGLADEISCNSYLMTTPPQQWLHTDVDELMWVLDNTNWLVAGLYCLAEEDTGAAQAFGQYLSMNDQNAPDMEPYDIRCAAAYLAMKAEHIYQQNTMGVLRQFYHKHIIEDVLSDLSRQKLYQAFLQIRENEKRRQLFALYDKLKSTYAAYANRNDNT